MADEKCAEFPCLKVQKLVWYFTGIQEATHSFAVEYVYKLFAVLMCGHAGLDLVSRLIL